MFLALSALHQGTHQGAPQAAKRATARADTNAFSDAKSLLGLSFALQSSAGFDIRLWGKNLTNEDLNINPTLRSDGDPSLPQPFSGRYYPGREYGLTLSYSF